MPGIQGQKTELTDGVKVNAIDELVTGAGVHIQGATDGNAIPTGYVGEMIGNATHGTNGAAYTIYGTNPYASSDSVLLTTNLNKGNYWLSCRTTCYHTDGSIRNMTVDLRIGGTPIHSEAAEKYEVSMPASTLGTITFSLPLYITADTTAVDLYGKLGGSSTGAGSRHEFSIIRIG